MPNGAGGGGGGGIVGVSNSFTGPAQALEIVGEYCYSYSGIVDAGAVQSQAYTLLEFTTPPNLMIIAEVQFFYADAAFFNDFEYTIKLNDIDIVGFSRQSGPALEGNPIRILLPAFTKFTATAANVETAAGRDQMVTLVGRIYRG